MSAEETVGDVIEELSNANHIELEETVARISSHKGVKKVLILNREGDILSQSSSDCEAEAKGIQNLLETATTFVKNQSREDEISFLQMKTTQNLELFIAPHSGYVLAVIKK